MNILAVDDEYYALELMRHALEEVAGGATVYLCRDVRSAIETATQIKIDVAFLDIHLPERNGIELALDLKKLNPKVMVSSAVLGKRDNHRYFSSMGWSGMEATYQDVAAWLKAGKQDFVAPMMYYPDKSFFPFHRKQSARDGIPRGEDTDPMRKPFSPLFFLRFSLSEYPAGFSLQRLL